MLAGFCHPMRLSDFFDFISVEREREDDDVSCSRRRIPLSQLEACLLYTSDAADE